MIKIYAQSYREDFLGRTFPQIFCMTDDIHRAKAIINSYTGDLGPIDFWLEDEVGDQFIVNDDYNLEPF